MAKKSSGGGLSLRTKDQTEGGGTEGALAKIGAIGFVDEFTYGGRFKDSPSAALQAVFEIQGFEKDWDQHYSVGPSDKYEVIADGDGIKSLGKATGLNKKSPAAAFLASVEEAAEAAGLDIDDLLPELDEGGNSIRPLEGRWVRLTNKKLETVGGDMKEYILIAGFEDEPDAHPARNGKNGKVTSSTKSSSKQSSSDAIEEKTIAAVETLIEKQTTVKKGDVPNEVYAMNRKDADAKAMMQLTFKEAWLSHEDRPWTFDKKKGVLRASS